MEVNTYDSILDNVNTYSNPAGLRITDIKVCDLKKPFNTTIIKILTNQGIEGYGQVREGGNRLYVLMLKKLIIGENPCNIDKLYRRIKQFGFHSHQGGGVSGIEVALWDIAGKAYGIPVWQMLGGRFRDKIRVYCDTDFHGKPDGKKMGDVLNQRIKEKGYTFMKMDLSADELLIDIPGAFTAPLGLLQEYKKGQSYMYDLYQNVSSSELVQKEQIESLTERRKMSEVNTLLGPFTGIGLTEYGLDIMEQYVKDVRDIIGYEVPLAVDHFGHIGVKDCIKLAQRMDKYNLAWYEDMIPWYMYDQLSEISKNCKTPLCTGEDIYLKENFIDLLDSKAVSIIHPDLFSSGGILETKKIGDIAQDYGVPMAIHMNETPIAALAAVQVAAATENFRVLEFHHNDYDPTHWSDMVNIKGKKLGETIVKDGFIEVPYSPGIGIDNINDEFISEHINTAVNSDWEDTDEWNNWKGPSMDRLWL